MQLLAVAWMFTFSFPKANSPLVSRQLLVRVGGLFLERVDVGCNSDNVVVGVDPTTFDYSE